ncbi:MAG: oxygen-independent coproporphyrinogen III oxidase [Parvularculaceae bacterium]|nr:oxygen-independent coproporphyrinogen III oxidase [Parvularculaceae bacterium]
MKDAWRKYLGGRGARYTSYPSAIHFDASVTGEDLAARFRSVSLYAPISINVHIPFCRQGSWFCGCLKHARKDHSRALDYINALIAEIAMHASALQGRGRPVSVHFGGGTLNYLSSVDIARVLDAIEGQLGLTDDAHLSIELDPRHLRRQDIDAYVALGFDRFSLGVQDFDPDVQMAVNRIQDYDLIEACVAEMRCAGVDDLSFDVLYGLPLQTVRTFESTLDKVIALGPDRVSVSGYAQAPAAFPHQPMISSESLADAALRAELAELADRRFTGAGYRRIGFDHYTRPDNTLACAAASGRLKRNFQGFADDPSPTILAVGASAISFVNGLYAQNEKDLDAYVERVRRGVSPVGCGLLRTQGDSVVAAAIGDLLCELSADVGDVLRVAAPAEALRVCGALDQLEADGVIAWQGDRIQVAEEAFLLARAVAAALDPYAGPASDQAACV